MRESSPLFFLIALAGLTGCPFESAKDEAPAGEPDDGGSALVDAGAGGSREIPWDWESDGGPGGAGGVTGTGGTTGTGGMGPRSMPPASPPVSNTPGAEFVYVGTPGAGAGLRFKSARLTLETIASTFQEWLAEVVNDSAEVLCLAKVTAEYKDAAGTVLAKPIAFADGPAWKGFGTVSSTCLPPGERGGLWDLQQVTRTFSLSAVRRVEYKVEFLPVQDSVPHPSTPTVTPGLVSDKFGTGTYWTLRGTLRAVATIHNYGVDVYPIGSDGMVLANLTASNPGALLPAGSSWSFETSGAKQRYGSQLIFTSFIDGPPRSPALPRVEAELTFEHRALERQTARSGTREIAAARDRARGN
jgi:hypothetical protein